MSGSLTLLDLRYRIEVLLVPVSTYVGRNLNSVSLYFVFSELFHHHSLDLPMDPTTGTTLV
jgi:hypothetical protein